MSRFSRSPESECIAGSQGFAEGPGLSKDKGAGGALHFHAQRERAFDQFEDLCAKSSDMVVPTGQWTGMTAYANSNKSPSHGSSRSMATGFEA